MICSHKINYLLSLCLPKFKINCWTSSLMIYKSSQWNHQWRGWAQIKVKSGHVDIKIQIKSTKWFILIEDDFSGMPSLTYNR